VRITRESLIKIANDTVVQRTRQKRGVVGAYLCGSLLEEDYLLGGTTDIDLVFVHDQPISTNREIVGLTEDIHLDIAHHYQREYDQARLMRVHPWLGPLINSCKILYDPRHFLDFIQATVRGQFCRPDHILARVRKQVEVARSIWLRYQGETSLNEPADVAAYLRAVVHVANAIAGLSGSMLSERRLLLNFSKRAEMAGHPGLYPGLLGLLGAPRLQEDLLDLWISWWQEAYQAIPSEKAPARLHPVRMRYYRESFEAIRRDYQSEAVLWPLLNTWTLAAENLQPVSPERQNWMLALENLGLIKEGLAERLQALDVYLDLVDETLETWGYDQGA